MSHETCILRICGKKNVFVGFERLQAHLKMDFQTSATILSSQSPFFGSLVPTLEDGTPVKSISDIDAKSWDAVAVLLSLVAADPTTPSDLVLSYPHITAKFLETHAEHLPVMWKYMHAWGLSVMIQRLKREICACLFVNFEIRVQDLMEMETSIQNPLHERFFESCYGIALARVVYNHSYNHRKRGVEEIWQNKETPIWSRRQHDLRALITRGVPVQHRSDSEFWVQQFPCFPDFKPTNAVASNILTQETRAPPVNDIIVQRLMDHAGVNRETAERALAENFGSLPDAILALSPCG